MSILSHALLGPVPLTLAAVEYATSGSTGFPLIELQVKHSAETFSLLISFHSGYLFLLLTNVMVQCSQDSLR